MFYTGNNGQVQPPDPLDTCKALFERMKALPGPHLSEDIVDTENLDELSFEVATKSMAFQYEDTEEDRAHREEDYIGSIAYTNTKRDVEVQKEAVRLSYDTRWLEADRIRAEMATYREKMKADARNDQLKAKQMRMKERELILNMKKMMREKVRKIQALDMYRVRRGPLK